MTTTAITTRYVPQEALQRAKELVAKADGIVVVDLKSAEGGVAEAILMKKAIDYLETKRKELVEPHNAEVKKINADFKSLTNDLTQARIKALGKVNKWKDEETQKADEERLAAEKKRQEAEERARAEEERLREEAEKKYQKEVKKAEKKGAEPPPKPIVAPVEADYVPDPIAQMPPDKISSQVGTLSTRANWKATVTDVKALAKAVVDGKAPEVCILPNQTFLNQQARAFKDNGSPYPGVEFVNDEIPITV